MQTIREHVDLIETNTVLFMGRMNFQHQDVTLWLILYSNSVWFAKLPVTPAHIVSTTNDQTFTELGLQLNLDRKKHLHIGKVKSWFERLQNSCDLLQGSPVGLQGLSASLVWMVWVTSSCWRAVRYLRLGSGYCNGCDQVRIHPCSKKICRFWGFPRHHAVLKICCTMQTPFAGSAIEEVSRVCWPLSTKSQSTATQGFLTTSRPAWSDSHWETLQGLAESDVPTSSLGQNHTKSFIRRSENLDLLVWLATFKKISQITRPRGMWKTSVCHLIAYIVAQLLVWNQCFDMLRVESRKLPYLTKSWVPTRKGTPWSLGALDDGLGIWTTHWHCMCQSFHPKASPLYSPR